MRFYNSEDRQQVCGARSKLESTPYGATENLTGKTEYNRKNYTISLRLLKKCINIKKGWHNYSISSILVLIVQGHSNSKYYSVYS